MVTKSAGKSAKSGGIVPQPFAASKSTIHWPLRIPISHKSVIYCESQIQLKQTILNQDLNYSVPSTYNEMGLAWTKNCKLQATEVCGYIVGNSNSTDSFDH